MGNEILNAPKQPSREVSDEQCAQKWARKYYDENKRLGDVAEISYRMALEKGRELQREEDAKLAEAAADSANVLAQMSTIGPTIRGENRFLAEQLWKFAAAIRGRRE